MERVRRDLGCARGFWTDGHKAVARALFALICVLVSAADILADTQKGLAAYRAGNYEAAYQELFRPAEEGDPVAQFTMGLLYYTGRGVPRNLQEARRWYRLAADQGYDRAQVNLGVMCVAGEGGPHDLIEGYMWFSLAAAQGNAAGREARDLVTKELTPDQLARAKQRALEWMPKPEQ
jgi:TPR repeat protein